MTRGRGRETRLPAGRIPAGGGQRTALGAQPSRADMPAARSRATPLPRSPTGPPARYGSDSRRPPLARCAVSSVRRHSGRFTAHADVSVLKLIAKFQVTA